MEEDKPKTDYKKYFCNKCKYKFRFKLGTDRTLRCPNCGGTDVMEDKFDMNKMIDEASNPMFDF